VKIESFHFALALKKKKKEKRKLTMGDLDTTNHA